MISPIASVEQARFAATSTWFFWIATSAAIPIIGALQWVFLQRVFGRHFEAQTTLLSFAILLLAAAPAILQWAVLRRLVPDLSFAVLVGVCWISTIVAYIPWALLSESRFNGERAFDIARLLSAPGAGSSGWLWLKLTLHAAIVTLIYNLVPIIVFGWLAKRSWRSFLVTTILGACAAVLLHKLYIGLANLDSGSLDHPIDFSRAQYRWSQLANIMATVGAFGMVQGFVGGYGLMRMFASVSEPQTPIAGGKRQGR